jgi:hypothetical protein
VRMRRLAFERECGRIRTIECVDGEANVEDGGRRELKVVERFAGVLRVVLGKVTLRWRLICAHSAEWH